MRKEEFCEIFGDISDELVEAARAVPAKRKTPVWLRRTLAAACAAFVLLGAWDTLDRFEYNFKAGCSAYPGEFANGKYYYTVDHSGVWSYTPGEGSKKELSTYWYSEWDVNDYGIYYWEDLSLYVREHGTGERRRLYSARRPDATHIRFVLAGDGNVIVTVYNKHTELTYELLVDGVSGEVIETVMERTSYDEARYVYYSDMNYIVGKRRIELVPVDEKRNDFILTENGESLLPDGVYVAGYEVAYAGSVWFPVRGPGHMWAAGDEITYAAVFADGRTELLTVPNDYYDGCVGRYLFFNDYEDFESRVSCLDMYTGEKWPLEADAEYERHNLATDGELIFTMAPWAEAQACWRLVYDDAGRPVAMTLLSSDIAEARE